MVCSAALGFFLLFLLHPALGVDNLRNIIDYLFDTYGVNKQFAFGINVPVNYCQQNAVLDQNFLLRYNNINDVKRVMGRGDRIYTGTRLIGARPKQSPGSSNSYRSEYLLLINSKSQTTPAQTVPLMQNLLNSDPTGCTVFYSLYSPCVNNCVTPDGTYSLLPALGMFRNRNTPKAFVFSYVWACDEGDPRWRANLLLINNIIPVFRCDERGCIRCVNGDQVHQNCL